MAHGRLSLIWRWALRAAAVGYPLALLAVLAAFRLVGERWWVTIAALYLPRLGFAIPLPVLTVALVAARAWRWLATQLVALALLLFPLSGLHLSFGRAATAGAPHLRVLTFNVDSAHAGLQNVLARVRGANPDLILIQEAGTVEAEDWREGLPGYDVDKTGQFVLASRFPIEERFEPPDLLHRGQLRSPHFVRYRIAAPGGPIQVYNVHPISPRMSLDDLRGDGLRHELVTGQLPPAAIDEVVSTAALRTAQLEAVVEDAGRSPYPVIIAGDTNLPEQSRALVRVFHGYRDAFADVGLGFGYSYPVRRGGPWVRIDRVLGGPRFRFLHSSVIGGPVSDHLPVVADVELLPAPR